FSYYCAARVRANHPAQPQIRQDLPLLASYVSAQAIQRRAWHFSLMGTSLAICGAKSQSSAPQVTASHKSSNVFLVKVRRSWRVRVFGGVGRAISVKSVKVSLLSFPSGLQVITSAVPLGFSATTSLPFLPPLA